MDQFFRFKFSDKDLMNSFSLTVFLFPQIV